MKIKKIIAGILAGILISAFVAFMGYSTYLFYLAARVDLVGFLKAVGFAIGMIACAGGGAALCIWIENTLEDRHET